MFGAIGPSAPLPIVPLPDFGIVLELEPEACLKVGWIRQIRLQIVDSELRGCECDEDWNDFQHPISFRPPPPTRSLVKARSAVTPGHPQAKTIAVARQHPRWLRQHLPPLASSARMDASAAVKNFSLRDFMIGLLSDAAEPGQTCPGPEAVRGASTTPTTGQPPSPAAPTPTARFPATTGSRSPPGNYHGSCGSN
jgi:hypothetical protein